MKFKPGNIDLFKWLGLVPAVIALVEEVVRDVKDGRIDAAEVQAIGEKLVAIVSKAV